jgi:hypothetical protein
MGGIVLLTPGFIIAGSSAVSIRLGVANHALAIGVVTEFEESINEHCEIGHICAIQAFIKLTNRYYLHSRCPRCVWQLLKMS